MSEWRKCGKSNPLDMPSIGGGGMKRIALIIVAAAGLSGCAQQWARQDDAKCQSYGAPVGSDAYVQCRMQQDAMRQAAIANFGTSLQQAGAALQSIH
jgi:hypothetical protein